MAKRINYSPYEKQVLLVCVKEYANVRHFQYTSYADVDTYVNTYADLKCRGRVSIFSNDKAIDM